MDSPRVQSGAESPVDMQTPVIAQPGGVQRAPRWIPVVLVLIALLAIVTGSVLYYARVHTGYLNRDACDAAQIARNVFTSHSYTTNLIRPFNLVFSQSWQVAFPELNRAPLFPCAVAGVFHVRGVSGQAVTSTSLLFFIAMLGATFWLGALLFDYRAGLLGTAVMGISKPMLEAATSGEEWAALGLWFTLLLCVVALHHRASIKHSKVACILLSIVAGVFVGLLYWTHYAMFFLIVPVAVYFAITGKARIASLIAFLVVALGLMAPLIVGNYSLTGSPIMGAAAWDVMADTLDYPGDAFYRSVHWDLANMRSLAMFPVEHFQSFSEKTLRGSAEMLGYAVTMLGLLGLPFAAVSSLYRFKNPQANAVRGLCYGAAATSLILFAALGLPASCVMMFAPVIAVIAAGYLLLLAVSKRLHPVYLRLVLAGLLAVTLIPGIVACVWGNAHDRTRADQLPQLLTLLNAREQPRGPVFSSQPWTVAWTLTSPSVWIPLKDADIDQLSASGLPMSLVFLTRECETYPDDDIWRVAYSVPWWLDYTANPNAAVSSFLSLYHLPQTKKDGWTAYFRQQRRKFTISEESVKDLRPMRTDPLQPGNVVVLVKVK